MSDKNFDDMNTEEKLKYLHDGLRELRNNASAAIERINARLSKLEKDASKDKG